MHFSAEKTHFDLQKNQHSAINSQSLGDSTGNGINYAGVSTLNLVYDAINFCQMLTITLVLVDKI